ncbi:MAG: hypothetical protein D6732_26560 [Methanobacteriota archaeon]|nr:MAG: hypothetical protein D6732_26560 [Euryarchaeota archaeon]
MNEGNREMRSSEGIIDLLRRFTPGVRVEVAKIAELLERDQKCVVAHLEEMQESKILPETYLEEVFIRSERSYQSGDEHGHACRV